jgi:DNA-binding NarL/FixJ family response regulator
VTVDRDVQVLICDDYPPMRALLRWIIEERAGLAVAGEARDGHEAIAEATRLQPDVILLDLAMPRKTGLEALQELGRIAPAAKVVIFSGFSIASIGRELVDLGAISYLQKGASPEAIIDAIEQAAASETPVTSQAARRSSAA